MKERLQELMLKKNISPKKLAEMIGVQPSAISHIISGRNKPGFEFLFKLFTVFPDVNPSWLILGKGNVFQTITANEQIATPNKKTKDLFEDKNTQSIASNQAIKLQEELLNTKKSDEIESIVLFFKNGTFKSYSQK